MSFSRFSLSGWEPWWWFLVETESGYKYTDKYTDKYSMHKLLLTTVSLSHVQLAPLLVALPANPYKTKFQ